MFIELFEQLGLSPNEAKIYEVLLSTGETSVSRIAVQANIHRRNIYDALNRLIEKGLVYRIFQSGEHLFRPVSPDKLMEIVKDKERRLVQAMPELKTMYEAEYHAEAAYIYKGVEGFKNYMRDMIAVGEETYFLGAKGLWYSPQVSTQFITEFQETARRKGFDYYTLYDPRVKEELPLALEGVGGKWKLLPEKYATKGVVDIFGDYVVTFTSVGIGNFGDDGLIFVMINRELAETYKTWFRYIWDTCPDMR